MQNLFGANSYVWGSYKGKIGLIEVLEQRINGTSMKLKLYKNWSEQCIKNRMFQTNERRLFEKLKSQNKTGIVFLIAKGNLVMEWGISPSSNSPRGSGMFMKVGGSFKCSQQMHRFWQ